MRITLAQLNPIVGDVGGNVRRLRAAIDRAAADGADVLLGPEMAVLGYPPRDLVLRPGVVESCERAVRELARYAGSRDPGLTVLVGFPRRDGRGVRPLRNSAAACRGGEVVAVYDKRLLPGYDVFDEDRYFEPGDGGCLIDAGSGTGIGRCAVVICEDLWQAGDVAAELRYGVDPLDPAEPGGPRGPGGPGGPGAGCILSLNASPFVAGKWARHLEQLREVAARRGAPIVAVNQVGANDDLIFDGRSLAVDGAGRVIRVLPGWREAVETVDLDEMPVGPSPPPDTIEETWHALVLGVRDYFEKTGHARALLGLSGGVDSALTAAVAVRALGGGNVSAVALPSRYSSRSAAEDARTMAGTMGLRELLEIPLEPAHEVIRAGLSASLGGPVGGLTDENVQARLRGLLLMGLSNAGHGLLLATSNKSEMAVGYCTLYGDMCGAVAVLGDVLKTGVYALASWLNDHHRACGFERAPIPGRVLSRAPSAELRPDQTDQDTLPPYEILDEIVRRVVEQEMSAERVVADTGFEQELVETMCRLIDGAEYKRHQAAVVLKVSPRSFGRGRPMPIAARTSHEAGTVGRGKRKLKAES